MGAKKFFREHFSKKPDASKEGDKGREGEKKEEEWIPMHDSQVYGHRAESSRTGGLREGEAKLIKRVGEVEKYIPEKVNNRKLLATTNERKNCGIHAMVRSLWPDLDIEKGVEITEKVRKDLIKDRNLPPLDVMPNVPLDLRKLGGAILDKMSKYSEKDKGLKDRGITLHQSYSIENGKHKTIAEIIKEGENPIHVYQDSFSGHYWGMGPESRPGASEPIPTTSEAANIKASLETEYEKQLAEALERSKLEQ